MRRIDPVELDTLEEPRQRALLLENRPTSASSRVQWWNEFIERSRQRALDATSNQPDEALARLSSVTWAIELAQQVGDLSPADAATLIAYLAERLHQAHFRGPRPDALTPEAIARRCLDAMPLTPEQIPAVMAVEHRYLTEDDRAWSPRREGSPPHPDEAMFDQLDDVRRLVACLGLVTDRIEDTALVTEVRGWMDREADLQHGEDITRRDREAVQRLREDG